MFRRMWYVFLFFTAFAIGLLDFPTPAHSGKPVPPPAPPPPGPGTICFRENAGSGQNVWGMASNGTAKSFLFSRDVPEIDEPSHLDYGGYRWWLTTVDDMTFGADVYAFRPDSTGGLIRVRLTDVAQDGINLMGNLARVRWSNDDAFITAVGVDNRTTPPSFHIWPINISGQEIDANPPLVSPVTVSDGRFSALVTAAEEIQGGYALSPDGTQSRLRDRERRLGRSIGDPCQIVPARDGSRFDWSPDGTKISFTIDPSVWIMNADGSGAKIVAQGKVSGLFPNQYSPRYLHSFWSPDGNWLAFRRDQIVHIRGSQYATQSDIVEMPATGGTIINLTGDMNAFSWKLAFAWRRLAFAYPNPVDGFGLKTVIVTTSTFATFNWDWSQDDSRKRSHGLSATWEVHCSDVETTPRTSGTRP